MAAALASGTLNSSLQLGNVSAENGSLQNYLSESVSTSAQNLSFPDDCITVVFSDMEFLPWDNPQNIVSVETETIASRVKNNLLVFLFLIGGPANVINMAVFYKQGLRDRVNLCLFALSLADELHLLNTFIHFGEQFYLQFTTQERFGPMSTLLSNANAGVLLGFSYVSYILSATIATERCLCIYNPLKYQSLLSTRAMAGFIIVVYIAVMGLFFVVSFRYRVGCAYDPVADVKVITAVEGEVYRTYKNFINPLESFIFGIGLPGIVFITVTTTTIMTVVKLRQVLKWRSQTTSSLSAHELALTKTLVVNSIFFIICMFPGAVNRFSWLLFPEVNSGKRHHNFFLMALWISETFTNINSTFNFVVYYVMGSRFRETLWTLVGKKTLAERK